jgi:hypothetical protein
MNEIIIFLNTTNNKMGSLIYQIINMVLMNQE